jgi:phage shock protein PspC (stress-responsive transcriptional regulator)
MYNKTLSNLYKSSENRFFTGVCAGIAEEFNVSVSSVRILFILLLLANGFGLVLYIMLSIILPTEEEITEEQDLAFFESAVQGLQKYEVETPAYTVFDEIILPRNILAFASILIGSIVLQLNIVPWALIPYGARYPVIIIIIGLGFILKSMTKHKHS